MDSTPNPLGTISGCRKTRHAAELFHVRFTFNRVAFGRMHCALGEASEALLAMLPSHSPTPTLDPNVTHLHSSSDTNLVLLAMLPLPSPTPTLGPNVTHLHSISDTNLALLVMLPSPSPTPTLDPNVTHLHSNFRHQSGAACDAALALTNTHSRP